MTGRPNKLAGRDPDAPDLERGPSPRTLAIRERRNKALRLRADGMTYDEIAQKLEYKSAANAGQDVQRALVASTREASAEVRQIELARLDILWTKAMQILCRRHVTVSQGRVVVRDGKEIIDDMPALAAIDRLVKIQERRAKLLGLDAPLKHEVVTIDMVEAEIGKLTAELAASALPYGTEVAAAPGIEGAAGRGRASED